MAAVSDPSQLDPAGLCYHLIVMFRTKMRSRGLRFTMLAVVLLVGVGVVLAAVAGQLAGFFSELGEFVTRLLEAVAWPLAILTVAWVFRKEIKVKLKELKSVTVGAHKAEFAGNLNEATRHAGNLERQAGPDSEAGDGGQGATIPVWVSEKLSHADELVHKQPKESVVAAFEPVKSLILEEAKEAGLVVVPQAPVSEVLRQLPREPSDDAVRAVGALEKARRGALSIEGPIAEAEARGYVSAARTVARTLARQRPMT